LFQTILVETEINNAFFDVSCRSERCCSLAGEHRILARLSCG
jgi:hypothetical protein